MKTTQTHLSRVTAPVNFCSETSKWTLALASCCLKEEFVKNKYMSTPNCICLLYINPDPATHQTEVKEWRFIVVGINNIDCNSTAGLNNSVRVSKFDDGSLICPNRQLYHLIWVLISNLKEYYDDRYCAFGELGC